MPTHSFSSPPSFDADGTLGALLVGVLFSYVLFGVTTTQTYIYSGRFPNDSRKVKILVAVVWLCELGHVVCIGHTLYVLVISDIGHPERLSIIPQSLEASTLFNAVVSTCVQGFLSFRIYRLWKRLCIPLLTWTLSFLFMGATVVVFVVGLQSLPFAQFEARWGWLLDSLWAVAAANDLIIALTLVFWLYRGRADADQITAVVDKLIAWTIETGAITSTAAILNLVCFVTMKQNFIWIAWYVVTARLYSNSFLASLNSRTTLRTMQTTLRTMDKVSSTSPPFPLYSSSVSVNDDTFLEELRTPVSPVSRDPAPFMVI
ncbi:hypothetical protein C8R47DRAFT_49953 [Mycena vitilis]|nr:hypothetical protein C8R47DRAFT_49953 [Mycena vitilis]